MGNSRWTPEQIRQQKGRARVPCLTAYDFPMARMLDEAGIPILLVGDSLGMVVLGYEDTTSVTMDDMLHHVRAVARAKPDALIVGDLPFESYPDETTAVANARRLIDAGADAVKAEGGRSILPQVKAILADRIPFMGHLGMLPQHVREEGGYKVKGRTDAEHDALLADAKALDEAGVFSIVLELVQRDLAVEISKAVGAVTIGIASGSGCDGNVLVTPDLLGTTPGFIPRHVKPNLNIAAEMRATIAAWKKAVGNPSENG